MTFREAREAIRCEAEAMGMTLTAAEEREAARRMVREWRERHPEPRGDFEAPDFSAAAVTRKLEANEL
jgi:hypothetical protein